MPVNPEQLEKAASKQLDITADLTSSISSFKGKGQQLTWKETQKRHDFGDNSATVWHRWAERTCWTHR